MAKRYVIMDTEGRVLGPGFFWTLSLERAIQYDGISCAPLELMWGNVTGEHILKRVPGSLQYKQGSKTEALLIPLT